MLLLHGLADRSHVGVGVAVQKLEKEREVLRVALVRRGREEEHVIGEVSQHLPQPVPLALVGLVPGGHPVSFVHDHQVPVNLPEPRQDIVPLGQIQRCDDLVLLHPLVHPELASDVASLEHQELLVELLAHLALPLEGQVRGTDHQDALDQAPQLEFANQQPRHDGLSGPGVVGQQEPHGGGLEQVFVDGFQLVWERIDLGDGETEIGIELVGDAQGVGLEAESQEAAVAVEGGSGVGDRELSEVVGGEGDLAELLGLLAHQANRPEAGAFGTDRDDAHGLVEQRAREDLAVSDGFVHRVHGHRARSLSGCGS